MLLSIWTSSSCGVVSCVARQRYPARWKLWASAPRPECRCTAVIVSSGLSFVMDQSYRSVGIADSDPRFGSATTHCTNLVSQMCACCVKIGLDRRLTPSARCLNPAVRPKLPRELADCTPLHPLASHWESQPKMGVSPGQTLNNRSLRGSLYIYINRRRRSSYIYI